MIDYGEFVALCASNDSEARGQAAHLAALAYLDHSGPADEQAALYSALIGFLDDPSARVRGALAYGLLHAREAPRPILLALLQDSPVIARAIAQYSPALIDVDLVSLVQNGDAEMLMAIAQRERLSARIAEALLGRSDRAVVLRLLGRAEPQLPPAALSQLAGTAAGDAILRGALLARKDLPAPARLRLVECVAAALREVRLVKGAVAPQRLERVLRDATDSALTGIGEEEARKGRGPYAVELVENRRISTRVMLHALVNGHVLFFAHCLAELAGMPARKVFGLLEHGSRAALTALLARSGLSVPVRSLLVRVIDHARAVDMSDDVAARHFVVTALTEELIVEHEGNIPSELEEAFRYLSEQSIALARLAARGVMTAFAEGGELRALPLPPPRRLALPAPDPQERQSRRTP
jgi:uncharacterized protein (DUF2336 family)